MIIRCKTADKEFIIDRGMLTLHAGADSTHINDPSGTEVRCTDPQTVLISAHGYTSYIEQAFNKLLPSDNREIADKLIYVSRVSDISPLNDGSIFILGSECMSIIPDMAHYTVDVIDACQPCDSCSTLAQIKADIMGFKALFNDLKDRNLYTSQYLADRMRGLNELFADSALYNMISKTCSGVSWSSIYTYWEGILNNTYEPHMNAGKNLFAEYITTVHMWNYLIFSQMFRSRITSLVDDPGAFCIKMTGYMPSCKKTANLKCTVSVYPGLNQQTWLRGYIPAPTVEYHGNNVEASPKYVISRDDDKFTVSGTSASWTIEYANAPIGTYMITLNVYPYVHVQQSWNPITIEALSDPVNSDMFDSDKPLPGQIEQTIHDTGDGFIITYNGVKLYEKIMYPQVGGILDATEASNISNIEKAYLNSKNYLRTTTSGNPNDWIIRVTWNITDPASPELEQTVTNTYMYSTPEITEPILGMTKNPSFYTPGSGRLILQD